MISIGSKLKTMMKEDNSDILILESISWSIIEHRSFTNLMKLFISKLPKENLEYFKWGEEKEYNITLLYNDWYCVQKGNINICNFRLNADYYETSQCPIDRIHLFFRAVSALL